MRILITAGALLAIIYVLIELAVNYLKEENFLKTIAG